MAEIMMNMALDDEMMTQAAGGIADVDPYGYVCEGTVIPATGTPSDRTMYSVEGDNGKRYWAVWRYRSVLSAGEVVQIIHEDDGTYILEPLRD